MMQIFLKDDKTESRKHILANEIQAEQFFGEKKNTVRFKREDASGSKVGKKKILSDLKLVKSQTL